MPASSSYQPCIQLSLTLLLFKGVTGLDDYSPDFGDQRGMISPFFFPELISERAPAGDRFIPSLTNLRYKIGSIRPTARRT